jgi:DNA-binding beta-propeller fold protein YncE
MFALVLSIQGQDKSPLNLIQRIPMPNVKGRLDHFGVDLGGNRLFVAALGDDQNTVEVIDLKMGKRVFSIPGQRQPQGVFYSPDFKKLFVANGADGTCKIFTGDTFKLIDNLPIGTDANHVGYDPATKYLTAVRLNVE